MSLRKSMLFKVNLYFGCLATGVIGADLAKSPLLRNGFLLLFALSFVIELLAVPTLCVLAIRRHRLRSRRQRQRPPARETSSHALSRD
jgi:hypothetical protein